MATQQIGANVAELRKARGAKQEDIAKAVGVSSQAVSKWENGGTPDTELLPLIADYLGVSIDRLFGREVRDYGDIETEVTNYVALPMDEFDGEVHEAPDEVLEATIARAGKLYWAVIMGLSGTRIFARSGLPINQLREEMQKNADSEMALYAHLLHNKGRLLASMTKNLPFFFMMPEPEQGWGEGLAEPEEYQKAFASLANPDILRCLLLLHEKEPKSKFSLGYFAKITGLDADKAEEIIKTLTEMNFLESSYIELDETRQNYYEFKPKDVFVAVLTLMKVYIHKPMHFMYRFETRKKPLLTPKGGQS